MKHIIATALACMLSLSVCQAQDNTGRQPENRQQQQGGHPHQNMQNGQNNGFPGGGFPGGQNGGFPGFPGGQNGGFPGFPGGGFPGGPGGFPGMMFGAMGNIDQLGVEFDRTPLKEKETVVKDTNDSTYVYYQENLSFSKTVKLKFIGETVEVTGDSDGLNMERDGAHVSFNLKSRSVAFELSGQTDDGSLKVKSDNPVKIVLNGVNLKSEKGEAIAVSGKADVYLVLSKGSQNRLEDQFREVPAQPFGPFGMMPGPRSQQQDAGETEIVSGIRMKKAVNRSEKLTESQVDGVLTCKGLLCLSGEGTLTVKGHNKSGLKSKNHTVIRPGNVVNIEMTQGKGISSKGDIRILGGVLNIDGSKSGKDGIHSDECIYILGGRTTVKAGGGQSSEGIEAKYNLQIDGGVVEVASFDDAINSGGNLIINGGQIFAASVMNDALDANSNLVINGGTIVALGGGAPECALDANEEEGFSLYINGGIIAGIGGMNSRSAKESRQASVICGFEQADSASIYGLADDKGVILQLTNIRNYFREASLLFSSPQLKAGKTYTVCKKSNENNNPLSGFHGLSVQTPKKGNKSGEVIETVENLTLPYSQVGRQGMMMGPPRVEPEE